MSGDCTCTASASGSVVANPSEPLASKRAKPRSSVVFEIVSRAPLLRAWICPWLTAKPSIEPLASDASPVTVRRGQRPAIEPPHRLDRSPAR